MKDPILEELRRIRREIARRVAARPSGLPRKAARASWQDTDYVRAKTANGMRNPSHRQRSRRCKHSAMPKPSPASPAKIRRRKILAKAAAERFENAQAHHRGAGDKPRKRKRRANSAFFGGGARGLSTESPSLASLSNATARGSSFKSTAGKQLMQLLRTRRTRDRRSDAASEQPRDATPAPAWR